MQTHNKQNYKKRDINKVNILDRFFWILWRKEVEFKLTLN